MDNSPTGSTEPTLATDIVTMCERCWHFHGQDSPGMGCDLNCGCHNAPLDEFSSEHALSNAVNRLRGQSAVERLTAGLNKDAEDVAGRVKGVLSLCGRNLTDSEVARVRAQLRAELLSFLIKANGEIGQEFFDMIAARGICN
jgi:hypothetical protein